MRQCAACRRRAPAARLMRLSVGPRHALVVDLYRRLPGRGAHTCASPACLRTAIEKGTFARSFKEPVHGDWQQLAREAATAMRERAVQLLGIGRRNGRTRFGIEDVLRTLSAQAAHLLVVSADAAERTRHDVLAPAQLQGVPMITGPNMAVLGGALGKQDVAVVAVTSPELAEEIEWLWQSADVLEAPPRNERKATAAVETRQGGA